jgi:hypothetical protein
VYLTLTAVLFGVKEIHLSHGVLFQLLEDILLIQQLGIDACRGEESLKDQNQAGQGIFCDRRNTKSATYNANNENFGRDVTRRLLVRKIVKGCKGNLKPVYKPQALWIQHARTAA